MAGEPLAEACDFLRRFLQGKIFMNDILEKTCLFPKQQNNACKDEYDDIGWTRGKLTDDVVTPEDHLSAKMYHFIFSFPGIEKIQFELSIEENIALALVRNYCEVTQHFTNKVKLVLKNLGELVK